MIADLDKSIELLLKAELPIHDDEIEVRFDQPSRTWSETKRNIKKPTVNFFLFDIRENNVLRQHQWEQVNRLNNGRIQFKRTPFRIDCHYILTSWAEDLGDEHRILAQAMSVLLRNPILPGRYLEGTLQDQPFEVQTRLASHDKLTNPAELWSALDNELRPSVSYIVTLTMDPWQKEIRTSAEPVRTQRAHIYDREQRSTHLAEKVSIAGRVTGLDDPGAGAGIVLTSKTGGRTWQYLALTTRNGLYRIDHVQPGEYVLSVWTPGGGPIQEKVGERTVVVPASVRVVTGADTFSIRIGRDVLLNDLHLTEGQAGYVGAADFGLYEVKSINATLPQSGIYHFGRDDAQQPPVAIIPAQTPGQASFQVRYKNEEEPIGNYDLHLNL